MSAITDLIIPKASQDDKQFSPLRLRGPVKQKHVQFTLPSTSTIDITNIEEEIGANPHENSKFVERSPEDLFADSDAEDEPSASFDVSSTSECDISNVEEKKIYKKMKSLLSGVPPPLSAREVKMSPSVMLQRYQDNLAADNLEPVTLTFGTSLFQSQLTIDEVKATSWPDSHKVRGFGLHYNCSSISESIEMMHLVLANRYAIETASSFFKSSDMTPSKQRTKRRVLQSPGTRLSHLAKRRTTFSSANLQAAKSNGVTNRQIVLKSKKTGKKHVRFAKTATPNRPNSIKKRGSHSKRRDMIEIKPSATRETSKRALFQSPNLVVEKKPVISKDVAERADKLKRALFSPDNSVKRKREPDDTPVFQKTSRLSLQDYNPSQSATSKPLRSFSFHAGSSLLSQPNSTCGMPRTRSDILGSQKELTIHHKQKLLWAVATVLREKNIFTSNPDYKKYASALTRVVKTIFLTYPDPTISSTSVRMKKIASTYVLEVFKGTSYDDILQLEKVRREKRSQTNASQQSISFTSFVEDENKYKPVKQGSASQSTYFGTALRENIDTEARQRSSSKKKTSQENSTVSPFSKSNKSFKFALSDKRTVNSQNDSLKTKRQISFDL